MKDKVIAKQLRSRKATPNERGRRHWLVLAVVIVSALVGVVFWVNRDASQPSTDSTRIPLPAEVPAKSEIDVLVGRWVRTDSNGGYTLEINSASADGKLEVRYFNPNPVNVGRAKWLKKDETLTIEVELRDANYPGSTYTLSFSRSDDQLAGTYYQAVEGVNYDVTFARIR